jgi:hypothetical protein
MERYTLPTECSSPWITLEVLLDTVTRAMVTIKAKSFAPGLVFLQQPPLSKGNHLPFADDEVIQYPDVDQG